jgi:hypothetical protein
MTLDEDNGFADDDDTLDEDFAEDDGLADDEAFLEEDGFGVEVVVWWVVVTAASIWVDVVVW